VIAHFILGFLGIDLDDTRNMANGGVFAAGGRSH